MGPERVIRASGSSGMQEALLWLPSPFSFLSQALIHDNTDTQTHSHQAGISLHATQLHKDTQVPTPTLWPLWSHIPSPPGHLIRVLFHTGSIFRFVYSPFLLSVSVYIISCILAAAVLRPAHPSPRLLISRCHPRAGGGGEAEASAGAGDRGRSDGSAPPLTSP